MAYVRLLFVFTHLLSLAGYISVHAQSNSLTFYKITEENGLSDNRVTCMLQDHDGFMWIGSEDGLSRYDGSAFKIYKRTNNGANEIAGNFVHALAEDRNHHLWVGTYDGLSQIDLHTDIVQSYRIPLKSKDINFIMKVLPDTAGNVWLGTLGGLVQFVPSQQKFEYHKIPTGLPADNKITDMVIDRHHQFWIATFNGLWQFEPATKKFKRPVSAIFKKPLGLLNTLIEDHSGKLWLGYWDSGLKWFAPASGQSGEFVSGVPSNIQGVAEIKNQFGQHEIWFQNFFRVDSTLHIDPFSSNAKTLLGSYHVTKFYSSTDGLLWAATNKGLLIMDPLKQFFHHAYISKGEISHQGIALYEKNNFLYLGGAADNFLTVYDRSFRQTKKYLIAENSPIAKGSAALNMVSEDPTHLWVCTESGLLLVDETTGSQQSFIITEKESDVPTRNFIDNMFIDSRKIHWVFPWRAGIWQFNYATKNFIKVFEGFGTGKGFKKSVVTDAVEDSAGNIWFADIDEGVIFFNRASSKFSKVSEQIFPTGFGLNHLVYKNPFVWGVTSGKIFRVNYKTKKVEIWPIPDDLNKTVTGFCEDHNNHLWITTRRGILSFDEATHEFKQFSSADGLLDDVMDGTLFCRSDGKIIYAHENYVTSFNPSELTKASKIPSVKITAVRSQNRPIPMQAERAGAKSIHLDYTYTNFVFEWAVVHFSNPLQNKYYCKLDGVDNEWKYVGNVGQAQYASLSPGDYVLRVRGATSDGVLNETGDVLKIKIDPPFWKTWWFYSVCSVTFLGVMYGWYRYRLAEAIKTERLRNKISTDLHDEIGSTLSSISIMSDLVVQKTNEEKTLKVAQEIRENAVVLMERMDDIVWSINPNNDSLENLLLRVQRFASHLFEAKNIDYQIVIDPGIKHIKLPMELRQNIYMILKESINNLVKHSQCSRASISVTQSHANLNVTITDNGVGFDLNEPRHGNGIASMKNRAALMKLNLEINSALREGSSVSLDVKIK